MQADQFILSEKYSKARHWLFWIIYGFCYFLQSIPTGSFKEVTSAASLKHGLTSLVFYLPACIISVYFFLHVLLKLLQKKRYTILAISFISFFVFIFSFDYIVTWLYFKFGCGCNTDKYPLADGVNLDQAQLDYLNGSFALNISYIAFGAKLARDWYLQQQENLRLASEKVKNELQLLKTRIDPHFLFGTMDILKLKIRSGSAESPKLVLKLSDLMSYVLYDSNEEIVPLEKELLALNDLIAIEKLKQDKFLTVHQKVKGETGDLCIVPLVLLPLLQAALINHDTRNKLAVVMDIKIAGETIDFVVSRHFLPPDDIKSTESNELIGNIRKRLNAFYPDFYFFETLEEDNNTVYTLNLRLNRNTLNKQNEVRLTSRSANNYEHL